MLRLGKILLAFLSWAPLAWTLIALLAARFHWYSLSDAILLSAVFYVLYGGFFFWLFLTVIFTWQKVISKSQCIRYSIITAAGLLSAYLAWHYDVFGLVGSYID